jgi:hypothetical protein
MKTFKFIIKNNALICIKQHSGSVFFPEFHATNYGFVGMVSQDNISAAIIEIKLLYSMLTGKQLTIDVNQHIISIPDYNWVCNPNILTPIKLADNPLNLYLNQLESAETVDRVGVDITPAQISDLEAMCRQCGVTIN